ncbi:MAG TPA: HTH domain-containing protein [Puia sp.]|nr:HTH domain-containing protein [Puia sp.]
MKSLLQRIHQLDQLIYEQTTGSPATLSRKIGVSERCVFDYLKLMKQMGAPISYSRSKGSYFYYEAGKFKIGFVRQ